MFVLSRGHFETRLFTADTISYFQELLLKETWEVIHQEHINKIFSKILRIYLNISSLKYLHLDKGIFCRVRRLAWCNDPESYASGSVAAGRATLAGQVKGEHPDKERNTGPPGWGLGRWASTPSPKKKNTHAKKNRQRLGKTDSLYNK